MFPSPAVWLTLRCQVREMRICYDQPQSIQPPQLSQWHSSSRPSRASLATLHRPRTAHSRPRPTISAPSGFRRLDASDALLPEAPPVPVPRRRSFRPLELSIYFPEGRLSPLPDFSQSDWNEVPVELETPPQALVRDSRVASVCSNHSAFTIPRKPVASWSSRSSRCTSLDSTVSPWGDDSFGDPRSLRRSNTQSSVTSPRRGLSVLSSPARSRSNTETGLPLSRHGSFRRGRADVDEAIRELNTIVEERRADACRSATDLSDGANAPPASPSHHIPAIAPALRMRVRSETLSDIGSAFSAPLVSPPFPHSPPPSRPATASAGIRLASAPARSRHLTLSGPLNSNPITPPTPSVPTPTSPIGRLGAWLRRSLPSPPVTPSFLRSSSQQSTSPPPASMGGFSAPLAMRRPPSPLAEAASRSALHVRTESDDTAPETLVNGTCTPSSLTSRTASPEPTIAESLDSLGSSPKASHIVKKPLLDQQPWSAPNKTGVLKGEGKRRSAMKAEAEPMANEFGVPATNHRRTLTAGVGQGIGMAI